MGIALAIWARYHLAEYWSARVTIKEDHQLIRTGPYTLTCATRSTPDLSWRPLVRPCDRPVAMLYRFLPGGGGILPEGEEGRSHAQQQFGEAFRAHQKHTGFLLPRFR